MKNNQHYYLLVDIGNTNTHAGLSDGHGVIQDVEFSSNIPFESGLKPLLKGDSPSIAVVASVVPSKNKRLKKLLLSRGIKEIHFAGSSSPLSIGIKYPCPETIGADRLVNAEAAVLLYSAPVVVIDFGTAVTFDIVNARRQYIGGVIAPGLAAMTDYLYQKTALLPKISLREPSSPIGKSTVQAMTIGAVTGYRGMITGILNKILEQKNMKNAQVVATGGYSRLISKKMKVIKKVNQLLTLKGLEQIALKIDKTTSVCAK